MSNQITDYFRKLKQSPNSAMWPSTSFGKAPYKPLLLLSVLDLFEQGTIQESNGMALCKLCRWAFDEGLFAVSKSYLIIPSPQLSSEENRPGHLKLLDKQPIHKPSDERLWPSPNSLSWHHKRVFRKY